MNLEGRLIGNRYEILEKIGNGGMATVYKAQDKMLKRYVAVKVLREEFTTDEEFIKRFNTEAQSAASLTHPNIVSIYDVGSEDNLYYIVMELIRGKTLKEAVNQIERYRRTSYKELYKFIQIYVVSNGVNTKYFANTDGEINFGYTFYWTDEENNRISNLSEFSMYFLENCFVSKMIARYMIINETDKQLMVMRPYQVYAVEALVKRALETSNNGYVWHTTGSGKTLTSFKASQILSNEPSIKQVFFLVDRKDLDTQTFDEFNKFEPGSVDFTNSTYKLVKNIQDSTKPLIITTIQKMANAINNPRYAELMEKYRDEKVVFIIDECHRSQFGDMHKAIKMYFNKAQYFGFTGTPRFSENRSQDGRTTADIFEKCLHFSENMII